MAFCQFLFFFFLCITDVISVSISGILLIVLTIAMVWSAVTDNLHLSCFFFDVHSLESQGNSGMQSLVILLALLSRP